MKPCTKCGSPRITTISGKCSDMCFVRYPDGREDCNYVPYDIGIGGGDYIEFDYCLECGSIQDDFPVKEEEPMV